MGFYPISTDIILQEHKRSPIIGRVLMIGRQNTGLTRENVETLLKFHGIPMLGVELEIDASTQHDIGDLGVGPFITDRAFFHAFADCKVEAVDLTDYEGAEIVHDMSTPVPRELRGQFDFIFDGSTLDNVFDPNVVMRNLHDLLKPGGRMVMVNWTNSFPTAYIKPSPDWFMDFFSFHEYEDAKVVVGEYDEAGHFQVWQYEPLVEHHGQSGYQCSSIATKSTQVTVCFAEKGTVASKVGNPVQVHYRGKHVEPYLSSAIRFKASKRQFVFPRFGAITKRPSISTFGTMKLLSDTDRDYDQRVSAAEREAQAPRPPSRVMRLALAYDEGRIWSGIRRSIGKP